MKSLEYLNDSPRRIADNFNRDSSFCQSRAGFVIHSGIHRSTAFISAVDHADGWFAFQYWSKQGQAAINAFIEGTIEGLDLSACEENACRKALPDWTIRKVGRKKYARELIATRGEGLQEQRTAFTWRHLHARCVQQIVAPHNYDWTPAGKGRWK